MPAPLSQDLRQRIVAEHKRTQGSRDVLAAQFRVGSATVYRLICQEREMGSLEPKRLGAPAGKGLIPDTKLGDLRALVKEKPDRTLDELCAAYRMEHHIETSSSTMHRALGRAGLTLKKRR